MEQEKKGLFGRLLDFWKEKTEENGGGIGFWNRGKPEKGTMTEKMQDALPQEKKEKPTFWEETMQRAAERKEEEQELFRKEGKLLFSEEKAEEKEMPQTAEESVQEKKTIVPIFTAEIFREETERRIEEEKRKTIFQQEMLPEEKEQRKPVPIAAAEKKPAEKAAAEETELPQEEPKKEREQAKDAEIDIERLMREMTKKLWEERETSGRRLRR